MKLTLSSRIPVPQVYSCLFGDSKGMFDNESGYTHIHAHIKAIKLPGWRMCPAKGCDKPDKLKGRDIRRIAEHIIFDQHPSRVLCSAKCRLFARKDVMETHRKNCCTFCEWCRKDCGKESRVAHKSACSAQAQ